MPFQCLTEITSSISLKSMYPNDRVARQSICIDLEVNMWDLKSVNPIYLGWKMDILSYH